MRRRGGPTSTTTNLERLVESESTAGTDARVECGQRLTVVGGCGAWPAAGQACSGYLVEHDGFRLLIDPGYARGAARAGVGQLLLTHLLPGTAPGLAEAAARATFTGEVGVAHGGGVADLPGAAEELGEAAEAPEGPGLHGSERNA
jgi:hypothetical protein